jgi:Holliday junction resolvasome RuvABC endonuclease subunit
MFLGLDQSYKSFGYCLLDNNSNLIDFGTIKTTDKDGDKVDRCTIITKQIIQYVEKHRPVNITIEGLAFGMRGDATRDLAGLFFVLVTSLRNYGFNPVVVTPLSLKKFATGSGKSEKAQMVDALPQEVKDKFIDAGYKKTTGLTDLADAYFLSKYASTINTTK